MALMPNVFEQRQMVLRAKEAKKRADQARKKFVEEWKKASEEERAGILFDALATMATADHSHAREVY